MFYSIQTDYLFLPLHQLEEGPVQPQNCLGRSWKYLKDNKMDIAMSALFIGTIGALVIDNLLPHKMSDKLELCLNLGAIAGLITPLAYLVRRGWLTAEAQEKLFGT